MYYIKNITDKQILEKVVVDGNHKIISLFPNEEIYNIEADSFELSKNSKLTIGKQQERIITESMKDYFSENNIKTLSEHLLYSIEEIKKPKKILVLLSNMNLRGQDKHIQYLMSSVNPLVRHLKEDGLLIINLIDFQDSFGKYYDLDYADTFLLKHFIQSQLEKNSLKNSDLIFAGISKGGSAAISVSNLFKGSNVIGIMPQFKLSKFLIDYVYRREFHYLNSAHDTKDFIKYIIPENKYMFYTGCHDTSSHHNFYNQILLQGNSENIEFSLSNGWHNASTSFKYDITYQVDNFLKKYKQVEYNNFVKKINLVENNLSIEVANLRAFTNRCQFLFEIKTKNKKLYFNGIYNLENNFCKVDKDYIRLQEIMTPKELTEDFEIKLIIRDITERIEYNSDYFKVETNSEYIEDMKKAVEKEAELLYYYRENNLLSVEADTLETLNLPLILSRLIVKTTEGEEFYFPIEVKERKYFTKFVLNQRRPVTFTKEIKSISIQVIDKNGEEILYKLKEEYEKN